MDSPVALDVAKEEPRGLHQVMKWLEQENEPETECDACEDTGQVECDECMGHGNCVTCAKECDLCFGTGYVDCEDCPD